jgi:hypothetical protein
MKRGVRVQFAERLHMKIYWTEDKGSIITSANLSTNALGSGQLKEIGIQLVHGVIEIDPILAAIRPFDVTEENIRRLDREHKAYHAKNQFAKVNREDSFTEWFTSPKRPTWKIYFWEVTSRYSERAEVVTIADYDRSPSDVVSLQGNDFEAFDWVLAVKVQGAEVRKIEWFCAEKIIRVPQKDKYYNSDFPYEAIQCGPIKWYDAPPFRLDAKTRTAVSKAVEKIGVAKLESSKDPSEPFVKLIARLLR